MVSSALASAAASKPDLILLDIAMPGMDGYEVCRCLKAQAETQDIPVIFVTAHDDPLDESKGLQLGAVDFIAKPIRPVIVQARVKTHLELSRQRDFLRKNAVDLEQRVAERTKGVAGDDSYAVAGDRCACAYRTGII